MLEKTLESSLDCQEIQPVHPKGDQSWVFVGRTDAEAETPILWPLHAKSWLIGKDPNAGRDWGQEEKGMTEDEMAGWHHRLNAHEFGWTLGVGDGKGGLACCDSWGHKESDTTERLSDWTDWTWIRIRRQRRFCATGYLLGLAGSDGEETAVWETGFDPWVRKIPWRRKWQPTPVFLPGKSLVGYSPLGLKESDKTEWLHFELWAQNRPCFPGKIREKANYSVTLPKCLPVMSTLNNNITKNHVKQIIDQQNLFTTN